MSVLWLIALTVAFALLQAVIFHHFNLRKLSYERHFSQKSAFEGQKVELIEGMRNEKLLPGAVAARRIADSARAGV